jgi:hypothetical protein
MSKLYSVLLVGLAISLAACSGQAPAAPTVAPTPTTVKAAPTAAGPAATPAQPSSAPAKLDPATACKVSASPKPASGFPTSLPADQSKGSDKAAAVLYEYSDFQ